MAYNSENIIKALSVDCVIFGFENRELQVLLYKRASKPLKGQWGIPGGFIRYDEDIDEASQRILSDFTGVKKVYMEQLHAFGEVHRFPLDRTITIVYFALVKPGNYSLQPGADASEAKWFSIKKIPNLIFDHNRLVMESLKGLKRKILFEPIGFELLPAKFTLGQLQELYEAILDKNFDKSNFRRKILNMKILIKLDEKQTKSIHRLASFYMFDHNRYDQLVKNGFYLDILVL